MHPATTGRKANGSPGLMTSLEVEVMAEVGGAKERQQMLMEVQAEGSFSVA